VTAVSPDRPADVEFPELVLNHSGRGPFVRGEIERPLPIRYRMMKVEPTRRYFEWATAARLRSGRLRR
jgi:hypothetical protein